VLASLWLTIRIALAATLLSILVGVPAGRALGLYRFRGKEIVELLILAPVIVPGIAVVLGIHTVFITLGLTNSVWGVILVHLIPTLPYMTLVMAGIFANFDPEYEQQARSLGDFTLVGCTVAPGFIFDAFQLAPPGFEPGSSDS